MKDTIVVANPGTGKTKEIVDQVLTLLQAGVRGEDIVCVTFTNKAADEMKNRIVKEISLFPELSDQALRLDVATIHGYAMSYLESEGMKAEIISNTVLRYIVYRKLLDLGTFNYGPDYLIGTIVPKFENAIRYLKSFGIMPHDIDVGTVTGIVRKKVAEGRSAGLSGKAVDVLVRDFVAIFSEYEKFKNSTSSMDFNDLLRIFLKEAPVSEKKYVLVDEFQDLNRMQVDIVGRLAENRFFVGDRKQSIFGFQGGSLSSFSRYLNDSNFRIRGKNINFRSTNNILDFATGYFLSYSKDDYSREEVRNLKNPGKGAGDRVSLMPSPDPQLDAVSKLRELISRPENEGKDFAIIARTNSQVEKIVRHLDSTGISYTSTIRNRVNQSQIGDILSYISGLVSEDARVMGRALMTPFSGLSLKEALDANRVLPQTGDHGIVLPEQFLELRKLKFGTAMIDQAFERIILPIATSIGEDYLTSAVAILDSAHEYLSTFSDYTLEGFLNYMSLSTEPAEDDLRKSHVNILTVHKAKGLEFDTVIYVPTDPRNSLEYFDFLTYAVISSVTGIDVERDLAEEPLRIDFVALTRAKENLIVVANERVLSRFELENKFYGIIETPAEPVQSRGARYNEPYMLFVNGRYNEAEKLLKSSGKWLENAISDYFTGISRLSYSTLNSLSNPYEFLRTKILKVRDTSSFAEAGVNFHDIAQKFVEGRIKVAEVPEDLALDFRNLNKSFALLSQNYVIPPANSEYRVDLPLSSLFPDRGAPDDITIEGHIDAVFTGKENEGQYLIADYKTSRKISSEHWHQVWLYTRMFQKKFGIKPDNISGSVIYVSLRESVETGEKDFSVQVREYRKIKTDVVEKRISEILLYMEQPEAFVEKILSRTPSGEFEERLREILENAI